MKKIIEILKKWWKIILVIILVIVGIIYSRITFFKEEVVEEIVLDSSFVSTFSETEKLGEEKMLIYVDVKGAVKKPGVYLVNADNIIKHIGKTISAMGMDKSLQSVSPSRFVINSSKPSSGRLKDCKSARISSPVRLPIHTVAALEASFVR